MPKLTKLTALSDETGFQQPERKRIEDSFNIIKRKMSDTAF